MHTLESYALNSGAKISKPFILEKYFPSVLDKYITLDCDLKTDSKKLGGQSKSLHRIHKIKKINLKEEISPYEPINVP